MQQGAPSGPNARPAPFRAADVGFFQELGVVVGLILKHGATNLTLEISYGTCVCVCVCVCA
jgi:hypothetical protein